MVNRFRGGPVVRVDQRGRLARAGRAVPVRAGLVPRRGARRLSGRCTARAGSLFRLVRAGRSVARIETRRARSGPGNRRRRNTAGRTARAGRRGDHAPGNRRHRAARIAHGTANRTAHRGGRQSGRGADHPVRGHGLSVEPGKERLASHRLVGRRRASSARIQRGDRLVAGSLDPRVAPPVRGLRSVVARLCHRRARGVGTGRARRADDRHQADALGRVRRRIGRRHGRRRGFGKQPVAQAGLTPRRGQQQGRRHATGNRRYTQLRVPHVFTPCRERLCVFYAPGQGDHFIRAVGGEVVKNRAPSARRLVAISPGSDCAFQATRAGYDGCDPACPSPPFLRTPQERVVHKFAGEDCGCGENRATTSFRGFYADGSGTVLSPAAFARLAWDAR